MLLSRVVATGLKGARDALRGFRARALIRRAESLLKSGDTAGAERCYVQALSLAPAAPLARARYALLLTGLSRMDQALQHYRAAQAIAPLTGEFLESFVRTLLARGGHDEARAVARDAADVDPSAYDSWFSLGLASLACHLYGDALEQFDRALHIRPGSADALANRGIALHNLGRIADAIAAYDSAMAAQPGHALARFHRSLALLATGEYERAWPEYETRLLSAPRSYSPVPFPRWDGTIRPERTLFVYGEQGLGDEIMFASCVPDLIRAGARCVLECHPALEALFARSFPEIPVVPATLQEGVPQVVVSQGVDCAVPIGSLPLHFRRSARDFPRHQGYLRADAHRVLGWRARLSGLGPGFKVGVSWRGGTFASRAPMRSIPLEAWLPILRVPGARFVSLQYTPGADEELRMLKQRYGVDIVHWSDAIADYDETAALVTALDLTISVCTSVVHLAAALGRPVWVMAPLNPEWRYGCSGQEIVWYPSARIFRQQRTGDWSDVISRVERELAAEVARSIV